MIIVVGHEKGGVGKSMLAVNLAWRIRQEGASVMLVDTDSTGTASGWYAIRQAHGVEPQIPVIKAPDNPGPVIVDLAGKYDAVIIDVGARDYGKLGQLARVVDFWLAPTQVSQGDLDSTLGLHAAVRATDKFHKDGRVPFVVVLNRTPSGWNSTEEQDAREYLEELAPGIDILKTGLKDRKSWRDVGKTGKSLFELPRRDASKAVEEFEGAYQEIIERLEAQGTAREVAQGVAS